MRASSNGTGTAGGKLVVFNSNQWAGDYVGAGVNAIQMQVNNQGATNLTLRLIFVNNLGQTATTVADVNVPSGSGWVPATFSLAPANLSGASPGAVMSNVVELNLLHSPAVVSTRSSAPNVAAQLGVDNVTAVPEPAAAAAALSLGFAGLMARSTRRDVRRTRT
jgi:hypothetical protein